MITYLEEPIWHKTTREVITLDIYYVTIMHLLSRFQLLIVHERILKIFRDTVVQG